MCLIQRGTDAADAPERENANAAASTVPAVKMRRLRFMGPPFARNYRTRKNSRHRFAEGSNCRYVYEMISSATDRPTWRNTWRWIAGLAACGLLGWWAFVRDARVPLLTLVNLGFHELGHLLTYWLPSVTTAMMGSINQVLVPLLLAGYFLWGGRDRLAAAFWLAWAATNAQGAAGYIADAPFQQLPLIGGHPGRGPPLGPRTSTPLNLRGCV